MELDSPTQAICCEIMEEALSDERSGIGFFAEKGNFYLAKAGDRPIGTKRDITAYVQIRFCPWCGSKLED